MAVTTRLADYADAGDADTLVSLLDHYARDPMGGGEPLSDHARANLIDGLRATEGAFSVLAFEGEEAIGLANCFTTFSTFAARPLVNIHDMVVREDRRGEGVGKALFDAIHAEARRRNACKVTLEVLNGNESAKGLYAAQGYGDYELDPAMGRALFWQKKL
ncbi:GNAT family N-acetyltransferase [Sphingomicrobium sp. XHP0235]|uniref:GNAT family N-acetyltransferase n=1 Tax=Sphingomicrobium aquimarinum TaxID=3133971 RepID=UPI0031FE5B05